MSGAPKKMPKRTGARSVNDGAQVHELRVEPLEVGGDRRAVAVRGAGDDHGVVDVEEVRPGDGERDQDPQDPERGDGRRGAQLAPGEPRHGAIGAIGEGILADRALAHVGEDEVLKVDRLDDPPGLDDRSVASHHEQSLAVGDRGRDHCLVRRRDVVRRPSADEPMVDGQQILDLAGDPDAGVHEHDEEVAHALDVAHEVRREHDAHVVARDRRHQQPEELAARQRVEAGHGLVEQEQLGALGERDREGQLGALAAREPARPLARTESELGEACVRGRRVPPGVAVRAEAQVVLDGEPRVEGRVLRDEADAGELGGVACRAARRAP